MDRDDGAPDELEMLRQEIDAVDECSHPQGAGHEVRAVEQRFEAAVGCGRGAATRPGRETMHGKESLVGARR